MELSLISEKLQAGRAKEVVALVQQALDEGMSAQSILQDGLMAGMADRKSTRLNSSHAR